MTIAINALALAVCAAIYLFTLINSE